MVSTPLDSIYYLLVDLYSYGNIISIVGESVENLIETEHESKIGKRKDKYLGYLG